MQDHGNLFHVYGVAIRIVGKLWQNVLAILPTEDMQDETDQLPCIGSIVSHPLCHIVAADRQFLIGLEKT